MRERLAAATAPGLLAVVGYSLHVALAGRGTHAFTHECQIPRAQPAAYTNVSAKMPHCPACQLEYIHAGCAAMPMMQAHRRQFGRGSFASQMDDIPQTAMMACSIIAAHDPFSSAAR